MKADRVRNDVAGWLLMAMIINWCVVLRVQCTLGSTSFFALRFLSLPAQVTLVVLFNIGPVTPFTEYGLFDCVYYCRTYYNAVRGGGRRRVEDWDP